MSDEHQRRDAAQSEEHEVLPGGYEVAPRSIPHHFDHSDCVDPGECEWYEFYDRAMNDGTARADPLPKGKKRGFDKQRRHVMISFRLNIKELEAIESAARARDMTLSSYLRECAMKTAAQPVVKLTNASGMCHRD